MDLTFDQKDLLTAMRHCIGSTDARGTMPILADVLLTSDGTIASTTLTRSTLATVPTEAAEPGSIALNAKDFEQRVKALPGPRVRVRLKGTGAELSTPGHTRRFRLNSIPGDEFPKLPAVNGTTRRYTIEAGSLAELIACTQFAVSTDETRLHLNCALLEIGGGKLTMVATDGHRLAVRTVAADVAGSDKVLVPLASLDRIRRLLPKDGTVELAIEDVDLFLIVEGVTFATRLVTASFPPYQQVIPQQTEHTVRVDREQLAQAVQAVAVSVNGRTGAVRLVFSGNILKLTAESAELGEASDEVLLAGGDVFTGTEKLIGVNARYLLDQLKAYQDETIEIGFSGDLDPMVIRQSADAFGILMPMRT